MNDPHDREARVYSIQKGDPIALCPMCHKELLPEDQLVAYYYAPKDWWVIDHISPSRSENPHFKYCGQAVTNAKGPAALFRVGRYNDT